MSQKKELFLTFRKPNFKSNEIKLIKNALLSTKALFDLDEQQKSGAKMTRTCNRGWDNSQPSNIDRHKAYRESFVFGLDYKRSKIKNLWPEKLDNKHRKNLYDFLDFSIDLCVNWYCKNNLYFNFKFSCDEFKKQITKSDLRIKAAAYFPMQAVTLPQVGCFDHEDYGLFTINFSNKCSDLSANIGGKWMQPESETIANLWSGCQIGYYSDYLAPTRHKVILQDNMPRYSLSLFIEV